MRLLYNVIIQKNINFFYDDFHYCSSLHKLFSLVNNLCLDSWHVICWRIPKNDLALKLYVSGDDNFVNQLGSELYLIYYMEWQNGVKSKMSYCGFKRRKILANYFYWIPIINHWGHWLKTIFRIKSQYKK